MDKETKTVLENGAQKKVLYSGIQPTGVLTIGNYIGAVKNWLELQDEYDCIYEVADLHSLTVRQNPADFRNRVMSFFAQYLALGLDPKKSVLYFQSHVPEHAELCWLLNCFTYVGEASRMTQFKEKSQKHADNINMGLMDYPVLMAADILLFQTDLVPVGIDQKQHLELARNLAERFNNAFSPTFKVPEPYISESGAKICSLQNPLQKMSKSDPDPNATVSLLDTPDDIRRKFRRAVTDSAPLGEDTAVVSSALVRFDAEKKQGVSNLMRIYGAFADKTMPQIEAEFEGKGYAEFKPAVAEAVIERLKPFQEEYKRLIADKAYLKSVAKDGAERAQYLARKTLSKVKRKLGLVER